MGATEYEYMVCVQCATYNQEKYITQTLEGIVSQKTNFPFCVIVVDDASTDHNVEIIRQYEKMYPEIVKGVYLTENYYSQGKSKMPCYEPWASQSKYIAICEGDDFWIEPNKLQKQVDFLESHWDYNLVCHNWNVLKNGEYFPSPVHNLYKQSFSFTFDTLPWVWITKTLTLVYRQSSVSETELYRFKYWRDVQLVYLALKNSKGYFMSEVMGTYRVIDSGIWSKVNQNKKNYTTYDLYKDMYLKEHSKALQKRYMNATLAYYNGLAYGKGTWWKFFTNAKLYFEALRNVSCIKDIVFCLGGLVPTNVVKWVMKKFKV